MAVLRGIQGLEEPVNFMMQRQNISTFVLKREYSICSIIFENLSFCQKSVSKTMKNIKIINLG